ncbi:hypothetical protein C8R48DRAFT_770783 [Suillus tomentosus]|nr:hypothetical protein C8R48DRAFT_781812 [Suillus tomentosus]KAG1843497.1 hypothetical protein C8R48DRAFT_780637 [Suillus tomentosus]KAG1870334.1 hypothetical protein C8R48DRAFT_770783 [Suillus tomentosus]
MQQSFSQTFKMQGNHINLNLRIEIPGSINQREKLTNYGVRESDIDNNCPPERNSEAPLDGAGRIDQETGEGDSMARLKERLELAELGCSRLGELYMKYRLRWLEENYRVRVLEQYAPRDIDTCSAHQIAWDAPSPVGGDDDDEVVDTEVVS